MWIRWEMAVKLQGSQNNALCKKHQLHWLTILRVTYQCINNSSSWGNDNSEILLSVLLMWKVWRASNQQITRNYGLGSSSSPRYESFWSKNMGLQAITHFPFFAGLLSMLCYLFCNCALLWRLDKRWRGREAASHVNIWMWFDSLSSVCFFFTV